MIRVLVVDDSATARTLLVSLLAAEPDMKVVGEGATGRDAVEMASRLTPDLITMDVHMPVMDGLEATKQIMIQSPRPIIIVSSAVRSDEVELSLEAMRAGALMVMAKPQGPSSPGFATERRQFVTMVRAMSQVKVVRRHGNVSPFSMNTPAARPAFTLPSRVRSAAGAQPIRLVAIGASTGGPAAVRTILADMPADFPVPILVVQHIAHGFSAGLADWLSRDTPLRVKLAELGEPAAAGTVYIAPDDRHLGCQVDDRGDVRLLLDRSPPVGAFRPSASFLFHSAAESLGPGVLAVILTGMGDDGVSGLRTLKVRGGRVLAQDESTSVIYGMPREAVRAGVVDTTLPITAIARKLVELTA
jgi:two-component system chemotaxis response regulator CheB